MDTRNSVIVHLITATDEDQWIYPLAKHIQCQWSEVYQINMASCLDDISSCIQTPFKSSDLTRCLVAAVLVSSVAADYFHVASRLTQHPKCMLRPFVSECLVTACVLYMLQIYTLTSTTSEK